MMDLFKIEKRLEILGDECWQTKIQLLKEINKMESNILKFQLMCYIPLGFINIVIVSLI